MLADDRRLGLDLARGAHHYRSFRWKPSEYDRFHAEAFSRVLSLGLRETHEVWEIGCGSLGLARFLVPFLRPGRYTGTEEAEWLLRDGRDMHTGNELLEMKRARVLRWSPTSPPPFDHEVDGIVIPNLIACLPAADARTVLEHAESRMHEDSTMLLGIPDDALHACQTLLQETMPSLGLRGMALTSGSKHPSTHWVACYRPGTTSIPASGSPSPGASEATDLPRRRHAGAVPAAPPEAHDAERAADSRLVAEIDAYKDISDVHDLPPIHHYWSNKYLLPMQQEFGFDTPEQFLERRLIAVVCASADEEHQIASVGSGNGELEIDIARKLVSHGRTNFSITCVELNPYMLERAEKLAAEHGVTRHMRFLQSDIAKWRPDRPFSACLANQSLHHFVELEDIFEHIRDAIHPRGIFLTSDMIGRNGHMRWPEAHEVLLEIWQDLPDRYKYNHQLERFEETIENFDCSQDWNEGIRAQDILPLLMQTFQFETFIAFSNLIDIFVDRSFGPNFDAEDPRDRALIDHVVARDEALIDAGKIKPCRMIAAMQTMPVTSPRYFKGRTPQFCVRVPD